MQHLSLEKLLNGLSEIRQSPSDSGTVELIVRRPAENEREELENGNITLQGLEGDNWKFKPSSSMPNGEPHPLKQITIMNSRAIALISQEGTRRALAGDQIYADLNLSYSNIPPGTRLQIGEAIVEVSTPPHRGCKKFADRFGADAMRFVNSEEGRELNLRGINTHVIKAGTFSLGDIICKLETTQL
ncbi:MAG: MOSC domain-containing protein [Bacteroidetes bacterium]|nr:MOSC domain-containing protein [Bacteroidota bacterium]